MIKAAAREQLPVSHPENPEIAGITIAQLSGEPSHAWSASQEHGCSLHRHTRLVPSRFMDWRARPLPLRHRNLRQNGRAYAKGKLPLQQDFVHEGILGTTFTGRLIEETRVGPYAAVVPTLSGKPGSPVSRTMWWIPKIRFRMGLS